MTTQAQRRAQRATQLNGRLHRARDAVKAARADVDAARDKLHAAELELTRAEAAIAAYRGSR